MSGPRAGRRFAAMGIGFALWIVACASPAAAQEPVGYWAFDACTGVDSSANAKDMTVNGAPVCGPAAFGNGYTLNGSSDYMEHASDPVFTPGGRPWSIVAWVRTTTTDPSFFVAVGWYRCGANPGCTASDPDLYDMGVNGRQAYFQIRDDAGQDAQLQDSTMIADGNWHLLVGTNNPGVHTPRLYVDGVLKVEALNGVSTLVTGDIPIPLSIGRQFRQGWGSPGNYFPGSIDEVRIYDVELTPGQVAKLYTNNNTPTHPITWGAIKSSYR